jgi:hypothetical protein
LVGDGVHGVVSQCPTFADFLCSRFHKEIQVLLCLFMIVILDHYHVLFDLLLSVRVDLGVDGDSFSQVELDFQP